MNIPQEPYSSNADLNQQGFADAEGLRSGGNSSSVRLRQLLNLLSGSVRQSETVSLAETILLLQTLAENSTDAVFLKDRDGRYLMANAIFARWTHRQLDEILGHTDRELFNHRVAEQLSHSDSQIHTSGETLTEEITLEHEDKQRGLIVTKVALHDAKQQVIGVIAVGREAALRQVMDDVNSGSQQFNEQIINHAREGVAVLDERMRFALWNPFMEEFIGIPKSKVLGRLPLEIFPTAGEAGLLQHVERALQGETVNRVDINLDTARGPRTAWASCSFSPHRDSKGAIIGVICTASDISERKKAEAALRRSQQFNQQIINNSSYGIVVYDRELRYMVWNPAMEEMSGMQAEDVLGRRVAEIFSHVQEQGLIQMLQQALKGDTVESVDFRLSPYKSIWVRAQYAPLRDADEQIIGVIGMVTNVTARRQAEEALRDSKQFNEQIINSALEGIAVYDRDLRILAWNPLMVELSGIPRAQTEGKTAVELFPHLRDRSLEENLQRALNGEVVSGKDFQFPKNQTRWASAVYGPLRNQHGKIVGIIATVRDITARRRAEEALRASQQFNEQVINSTLDCIAVLDTELNAVIWNPAMERLTNVKAPAALSKAVLTLFPQMRENGLYDIMKRALVGEVSPRKDYEFGEGQGWYNAQIAPLRNEQEEIVGVISVLRDVTDRHQAEEALRESKQFNEQIIHSVKEGIVVHDRQLRYVEWNPFMEELRGMKRADVIGKHPYEIFPELLQTGFKDLMEGVLAGETTTTSDFEQMRPNGKSSWVSIRYEPLRTQAGDITGVLGVINDITERKQAEDALRSSQQFSEQIIENAREGFIVYDRDFHVKVWNRFMEEVTGLTREQVAGKHPFEVFPYLRTTGHLNLISSALNGDAVTGQDFQLVAPNSGKKYWLSARYGPHKGPNGESIGVIVTLRDMTARRFAEQAVRESEERYRKILETIQEGYFEININGDLVLSNDSLSQIYGCDKTELFGQAHWQWITTETVQRVKGIFNDLLGGHEASWVFDYKVKRKSGEVRILETSVSLICNSDQEPTGYRGLVRDVTDRRMAEMRVANQARYAALRADVTVAVAAEIPLNEMLQKCAEAITRHLGATFARIWMLNENRSALAVKASAGQSVPSGAGFDAIPLGEGDIGRIAAHRQPLLRDDLLTSASEDWVARNGIRAFAGCPLMTNNVTQGVLAFWSYDTLPEDTLDSLLTACTLIAQGIERRQIEQSLQTSEHRFRALIEHSFDGIILLDAKGLATYVSPAQQQILGFPNTELLGKSLEPFIHPDSLPVLRQALKTLPDGQSTRIEYRARNVHNSYRWLEGTITNLLNEPSVQAYVINFHDITAPKLTEALHAQAEASLRTSEEQMRSIWTNVLDAMLLLNDEGYYTDANPAACALFSLSKDELVGQHFTMFAGSAHREASLQAWQKLLDNGRDEGSFQMPLPGRGLRWIEYLSLTNVMQGRHLIVYRDITERRDAEAAVRANEARFRALTESSWDAITMHDRDGRVVYVSPAFTRILGYQPGEVMHSDQSARMHPDDRERMLKLRDDVLANPGKQFVAQHRVRHRDGSWRLLESAATNLLEDTNIGAVVVNFRDVTARDQAERLMRTNEQRFRTLVEKSFDGIVLQNGEGVITYASPSVTHLLGYEASEFVGHDIEEFIHPDHLARVHETRPTVRANPGHTYTMQMLVRHKDSSNRLLEIAVTNWLNDPSVEALVINFRDVTERQQAEESIRQREEKFRAIWNNAMDAMLIVNDEMEYVDVNPAACELYGLKREDIINHSMADFVPPEKRQMAKQSLQKLIARGERKGEFQLLRPDHSIREIEYSARANFMPGLHLSVMRDVTERARAEEQLRASEDRYRSVVSALDEGILMIGSEGEMLTCNQSATRVLGMPREELLCLSMRDERWRSVHEDGTPFSYEESPGVHTLMTGEPRSGVVWGLLQPNGETTWISVNSHPVYQSDSTKPYAVVLSMTDITERKRTEAAKLELEARFAAIFSVSPLPICLNDEDSGKTLEVNAAWLDIFGYSMPEVIGKTGKELEIWQTLEQRDDYLERIHRDGHVKDFVMSARTKQGEARQLLNFAERFELNGKRYYLSINQDITERLRAEERFVKAFDANPNPMVIIALATQRIVQTNSAWQKFSGFAADDFSPLAAAGESNWVHEDQRVLFYAQLASDGNLRDLEVEIYTSEHLIRTVLISAEQINLDGQPHVIVSANDITERKRADEAVRVSEERFAKAFNACPDPMAITTIAEGRYVMVNQAWSRVHGLSGDAVIGHTSQELELWVDAEARRQFYEHIVLNGSVRDFETRQRNANGGIDHVLISAEMVMLGGEWYVLSVTRDITERKQAEEALRSSELRFASIFNACPEPMVLNHLSDGRFVAMNEAALRGLGIESKEAVGRTPSDINLWVDENQQRDFVQRLTEQGEVRDFECNFYLKGKRVGDFLITAEIIEIEAVPHVLTVARDVTERKRAEAALRTSEERLAQTFDACPEPMLLNRVDDSRIVAINRAALATFGWSREAIIGKSIKKIPFWTNLDQQKAFNALLNEHKVVKDFEFETRIKDGVTAYFLISAEVIQIDGIEHTLCLGRDITERKQDELALRLSEERFSKAFAASPHPIAITAYPQGNILMVNEAWTRLHGLSDEEVKKRTTQELNIWVKPEQRREYLQQVEAHGSVRNFECEMRDKDGETRYILLSGETMQIGESAYLLSIALDLTESRATQAALRFSEERFEQAFRLSPHPMIINSMDGRIALTNQAFNEVIASSPEDLVGKTALELGLWDDPSQRDEVIKTLKETGSIHNRELNFRSRNGDLLQTLYSAEIVEFNGQRHVLSSLVEITERVRIENELRASQERFATAFHASPQAMVICQAPDNQAVSVNASMLKLIDLQEAEVLGHKLAELALWSQDDMQSEIQPRLAAENKIRNWRIELRTKQDALKVVEVSVDPIQLNGAAHLLFIFNDVTEREHAEAERRASEERFSKAFTASPQPMVICKAGDGAIVSVNSSMLLLLGRAESEVIGKTAEDLDVWTQSAVGDEIRRRVKADGRVRDWAMTIRRKNGDERFVQLTIELIQLNDEPHLLFICNDVTERRRAEEALSASEERFSKAFQASPQAMLIAEAQSSVIVSTNISFCLMLGYEEHEVLKATIDELDLWVKTHQRDTFKQLLKHNGHLRDWTTDLRRKDGAERTVQISVEPVQLNGAPHLLYLLVDITERKQSEEALRASEERFSTAFQANPQPMGIFRAHDQKFVFANQAFLRQLGRSEEDLIGSALAEVGWWTDEAVRDEFLQTLEKQRHVRDYEAKLKLNAAEVRMHLLSAEYLRLDNEPHVVVVALDITERHRAQEELRASEERFSKAFNASPQPMVLAQWPSGELVSINRKLAEVTGFEEQELIGKRLIDLNAWLTPSDRAKFLQTVAQGPLREWEVRLRIKSGDVLIMQLSGETVELEGKPHLLITATDVTARKRAEAIMAGQVNTLELMASGAKLPAVLDAIARFVEDQQFGARTSVNLYNAGEAKLSACYAPNLGTAFKQALMDTVISKESGVNGAAIVNQQIAIYEDLQKHEDWPKMGEFLTQHNVLSAWAIPIFDTQRRVLGTVSLYYEQPHSPSVAELKLGEIAAQLAGIALEHHEAEQALLASEGRYRLLFERNLAGVYRVLEDGQFLECNDAFAAIFGFNNAEEILRHKAPEFFFEPVDRGIYMKLLQKQGSITNYEMRLRRVDDTELWVLCNASLIPKEGEQGVIEGVMMDITKRKQAEAKLNEQREQLRALTAKISAIREEERTVISREIHDSLGQLLTGLKLDISWLGKRINQQVAEGDTRKQLVKKTDSIAELLDQTISTVRELATQLRPGVLDTLGLTAAIEWQVQDFQTRSGIECELWLCPEPKNLPQEKSTVIFRILQEILTNIIRHAEAKHVVIHLMPNADSLLLTVIDDGRGITTGELQNPKSLGLLGMRERANSIGGSVKLDGVAGRGTTVTVRIPLNPANAEEPSKSTTGLLGPS